MHSVPAFLAVALAVTLTPGPAFALLLQTAAVHGARPALANIAGNGLAVLGWGVLSAAGVSALVAASEVAYLVLKLAGAAFLVWLGLSALLRRRSVEVETPAAAPGNSRRAFRRGLLSGVANPKLALFFVALFPQFVEPGAAVLPAALAMASVIVACDVVVYGGVALLVDRFRRVVRPRLLRGLERVTGAVLLGFGVRLATSAR